ncbi:Unknown protein [Striga hermonthica]|uniref:Transmembrane protein n=1 Tax=Striga hermonthica TaxID=68872 RepID=A0A9N7R705_STRHE|nr:Unknown protein [Striga hermonthica]
MSSKKTLVTILAWLIVIAYIATASFGATTTTKPSERVVYPQGCRCCRFDYSKQLITCARVCCGDDCC